MMNFVPPAPYQIRQYREIDSTQEEARRLLAQDVPGWTIVLANRQTGGRGRFGRPWASPEGNLYMTLILRPRPGQPPVGTAIGLANLCVGLAVAEAALVLAPDAPLALKWPNDLLLDGAKMCGILSELVQVPHADPALLIGIGVNLAHHPDGLAYRAAHLGQVLEGNPAPHMFLDAMLPILSQRLGVFLVEGFEPLRTEYLARLAFRGEAVRIALDAERTHFTEGVLSGIDRHGRLVLAGPDGEQVISAGDVTTF